jgi:hypothetical protein
MVEAILDGGCRRGAWGAAVVGVEDVFTCDHLLAAMGVTMFS